MDTIIISINGKSRELQKETTVLELLLADQYDVTKLAVEKNGKIVPKADFSSEIIHPEDVLEVVTFVGGG
ncbi:sulfur carrier protein [Lachnospiraceae bacterium PF1-22]|uniref:sulfur carrier protein ThiS n=1 Tax=Ohessyouella blattaphilus TaxID=2949333 RepID=UPI003E2B40C4